MTYRKNTPSPLQEISQGLSGVATIAGIGASGAALLDAYLSRKDLARPVAAFLLSLLF